MVFEVLVVKKLFFAVFNVTGKRFGSGMCPHVYL